MRSEETCRRIPRVPRGRSGEAAFLRAGLRMHSIRALQIEVNSAKVYRKSCMQTANSGMDGPTTA